jgi:fucose permease
MGIQMGSAYVGTTLMPPIFGWLASRIHFGIFPVFIGIVLIIKMVMIETLNRKIDKARNGTVTQ